ncbi:hypothetical protein [Prochlorococcus marinus]|uniref:hypothetical protein n=1 Tax=Prochlorococcus marinus TaxID=1219 RepID=UPI0022B40C4B|nr:hypothetical protein [Prochlorococcus marinus]
MFVQSLAIEPEIIPNNSDAGEEAKPVYPKWITISILIIIFSLIIFFLNAIITFSLMIIGVIFIWRLAKKKLSSENTL